MISMALRTHRSLRGRWQIPLCFFADDVAFYRTAEGGEHLKGSIQDVLDQYRDIDMAAKIRRQQSAQQRQVTPEAASSGTGPEARHSEGKPLSARKTVKGRDTVVGHEGPMHRCLQCS